MKPRPYQQRAIDDIKDAYRAGHKRVAYAAACGSGKTVIFSKIAQGASVKEKDVTIVAHRKELITQCSDKLKKCGVDHGIIKAGYPEEYDKNIQVASIQTLSRRDGVIDPDLFIYDECHHSGSPQAQAVLKKHPDALLLGVSASPENLGGYYDVMVTGPGVPELVKDGYLVETILYAPPVVANIKRTDYESLDALENAMNKRKVTGDAIEHYKRLADGLQAIVYVVSVKHGAEVAAQFREAGYSFYAIHGMMEDDERDELLRQFAAREIQGLVSADLISEGTDVPSAQVAIKLRPTKSRILNIQQDGRINRPFYADGFDLDTLEGRLAAIAASHKPHAICIDHVANYFFNGYPDDEFEWSLTEPTKVKPRAFAVSQCEGCYRVFKGTACPHCSMARKIVERRVLYTKGELEVIKKEEVAKKKEELERVKKQKERDRKAAKTLPQLIDFAKKYEYENPEGWARNWIKMRGRYKRGT